MFKRIILAGAAAVAALALAAAPAMASSQCSVNCTNGTVNVGSTIGTTGFPTSFSASGQAGTTVSAVASPYSVYSNTNWTLTFGDTSDDVLQTSFPAVWSIGEVASNPAFPIYSSTTIGHNGTTFNLPSGNGTSSVQIDSGGATAGGQNYADQFNVAIPSAQAPGAYTATFDYVLAGS